MENLKVRLRTAPRLEMSAWIDFDRNEVMYSPYGGGNIVHGSLGKFLLEWELVEPRKVGDLNE